MSEDREEFTMEKLNAFLKTLKSSGKRIERMREYIEKFASDNFSRQTKLQKEYDRIFEEYLELENRLMSIIKSCLTDEEIELIISHYILGISFQKLASDWYCDRMTLYRWLKAAKEKIIASM